MKSGKPTNRNTGGTEKGQETVLQENVGNEKNNLCPPTPEKL